MKILFLFSCILFLFSWILLSTLLAIIHAEPSPTKVLFFQLILHWPNSYCHRPRVRCHSPIPQMFTIHGIWPCNSDFTNCNIQLAGFYGGEFAENDVQNIRNHLNVHWPNLDGDNLEFWNEQWNKHGVKSGLSAPQYFEAALTMNILVNQRLGGELRNFFAGDPGPNLPPTYEQNLRKAARIYARKIFVSAGTIVEIQCHSNEEGDLQLSEVRFCFYGCKCDGKWDWKLTDCNPTKFMSDQITPADYITHSCSRQIIFPPKDAPTPGLRIQHGSLSPSLALFFYLFLFVCCCTCLRR